MITSLKHLIKLIVRSDYRKDYRIESQLNKIRRIPRYNQTVVHVFDKPLKIVDSASFLFIYNEIFKAEIYKFGSHKPQPYIIDCGANVGLSILYFKKLHPKAEILAFEPDPVVFKILQENIASFKLNGINIIPEGVWDKETTLRFYSEGADGGRIALSSDKNNITEIQTRRLRPYLKKPVDFLKIDIEGAELDVLKDCYDLLGNVENLFVEYHSFVDQKQKLDELLKLITDAGYRYYIIHNGASSIHPFVKREVTLGMDCQLNIYARRF